jgi:hypothetical protein
VPRGNCYVTCEALYHLLGGKAAGWKPMTMRHEGDTHWFLAKSSGLWEQGTSGPRFSIVLDPTVSQFETKPDYEKARGCGFLTKQPSKRAAELIKRMLWQS